MKKRLLSLVLALAMALTLLPSMPGTITAAANTPWDGATKTEPKQEDGIYQIGTAEELAWFAARVNELGAADTGAVDIDAVLTSDIDLGNQPWTPISLITYVADTYAGTFDGGNHIVSGLRIDATAANYGLFAIVNGATIQNLKVEGNVNSNNVTGGIVGKLQTGTVKNCSMSGTVTTTGTSTKGYVGGIIGTITAAGAKVIGCCNTAAVSGTYAGGILGQTTKNTAISSCYNTGKITGGTRSGGIVGHQTSGSVSYCYSIGESTNGISSFCNATVTNCYYLAEKTSDVASPPGGTATGYETIVDPPSLLEKLNEGSERLFCEDAKSSNQGYPVLNWQLVSSMASVPVTTVAIQGDVKTGSVLTAKALGVEEETATNVKYQWAVSEDQEHFTNIENETGSTYTIPDTVEYLGKYVQVTATGEENSSATAVVGPIVKSDAMIAAENKEKAEETAKALTLDIKTIKEETTLSLPFSLNGCTITWTSDQPDIISNTGRVTLPEKDIVSVVLKAEVACGSEIVSKEFTVHVWANDVDAEVYLQKILDSMEWSFSSLQPVYGEDTNILAKLQRVLKEKGFDGVTATIQSTEDESLISQNGKIFYPAVPEGSFANGKQVQVFFRLTVGDTSVTYPTENTYSLLVPWDMSSVTEALENVADTALTEKALCNGNESLSAVASDLELPAWVDGDKYSAAQITWISSDEAHLAISDENRKGSADALYNPYIGKVYQDQEEHEVILTATLENPSTDITVTRSFSVVVSPMSEGELSKTLDQMNQILACYTPDKLTDFVSKETIDLAAVKNDIQLVIPKKVVTKAELTSLDYGEYWDYWNYKFTVTSSDTSVIEVNGFRAYVYRPLGEDRSADKKVTLEVVMTSKSNPNLSVAKEMEVTVTHLGRKEINQALALMDQAKSSYAEGLLGSNTDVYSVIDNLTPYQEIVWNQDQSGIDFIYCNADRKNNGIVVDELPGWEEQEDWRLFHTSNRNLLSNETLILNETPSKDTFVKINSVLTDEVFGKYYTKFQNEQQYDAEALAKFKQLFKQPVSTYVMVVGAGNYNEAYAAMTAESKASACALSLAAFKKELDQPISVSFTLVGLENKTMIEKTQETSFVKGATVFDVFKKVLAEHQISYTAKGSYITSIDGLSELDYGARSGWMYTVGGVLVNSYMNAQELSGGEDIVVKYVTDYTLANIPEKEPGEEEPQKPVVPGDGKDDPQNPVTPGDGKDDPQNPVVPGDGEKDDKPVVSGNNHNTAGEKATKPKSKKTKKQKKKKAVKTLRLKKYKRGTKRLVGKTVKGAKLVVKIGKKKYTVKANKKGKFTIKLKKKLKRKTRIRIRVTKKGYQAKTKVFKVK